MQNVLKGMRTKRKLAAALKALLESKPLERVRIHDLTDRCEIHRQTFYYHFEDVYDLFAWTAAEDAGALEAALAGASGWREALGPVLDFLARDRGYTLALLDHPAAWGIFRQRVFPAVTRWDARFPVVLEPLTEKWIREGAADPAALMGLLESLTAT